MAATAAVQLNTNERGIYFISINRRFCASGVTASALFQSGFMSVTGKEDESGNIISVKTRGDLKENLGISPATASRNNHRLSHAGIVDKQGINTYVYHNEAAEGEETKKWYCPTEILTETFEAKDDEDNTIYIKFTYCDSLVYSYFYTLLPHVGRNQRTIKAAFDEIAKELGIDPSTVSDAVKKLRAAGLIYFPCGWMGKNRYKKSKIGLRHGFSWFKREKLYRAILDKKKKAKAGEQQQDAPKQTPQKTPVNAATKRKAYYDAQQAMAEKKAAKALAEALKNKDFRSLHDKLSDIQYKYNDAIIHNNAAKQQELSSAITKLKEKQASVLKNIGISPEQLRPEYYIGCKECRDTGVKEDGTECNCFDRRGRGSPPGKGKKKVVGELNTKN